MIGVTKLLCGATTPPDALRYRRDRARLPSQAKKPVVVWNMTRRCNLRCLHCYLDAQTQGDEGELTTEEGKDLLDDLAAFGAPVILFSGGEPLLREDLMDLGSHAVARGLRAVISTNGTLITESLARRIREAGFSYVGVSLDGIEATNDSFRGQRGAFAAALKGIRNCREVGVRTGLRLTLSRRNLRDLPAILDLLEEERIPRCCFYHLVYAGRAGRLREEDLGHDQTREALDLIFERARLYHRRGVDLEILTVDNHADGVYLYQDEATERRVAEEGVPLEVCPTSNLHISGFMRTLADHPLRRYLELGIPVTLNTDNRLMSQTSSTEELHRVIEAFSLSKETVKRILLAGARAAFAPKAVKAALRERVEAAF